MASHDFTDAQEEINETKKDRRRGLSRRSGRIVSDLAVFRAEYDELFALSDPTQQAALTIKFNAFKLDAKNALGL